MIIFINHGIFSLLAISNVADSENKIQDSDNLS